MAASAVEAASRAMPGGFALEVLVPWSAFDSDPGKDEEVYFQTYAISADRSKAVSWMCWHPVLDERAMLRLRLGGESSPSVEADVVDAVVEPDVDAGRPRAGRP
jgi:hypothetical protein